MITEQEVNKLHQRAVRRMETALMAMDEYKQAVDELLEEANARSMSQKLSITRMAVLLEVHRTTLYRMGASDCNTYAELWSWVKDNRPELRKTLERNYTKWKKS